MHDTVFPISYLRQHYPDFRVFLGAYIGVREGETLDEVTKGFVLKNPFLPVKKVIRDSKALLQDANFPLKSIIAESNIPFKSEEEAKEWLRHTIDLMEKVFQSRKDTGEKHS